MDFNTYTYYLVTKYQMELRSNSCLRVQGVSKFSELQRYKLRVKIRKERCTKLCYRRFNIKL